MTEQLCFWTTGEAFTNLLEDFFEEGQFKLLYLTLKDGGLPEAQIIEFFNGLGYFEGDTRTDGTLSYHTREQAEKPQDERWYWAMRNFINIQKISVDDEDEDEHCSTTKYKYSTVINALDKKAWETDEYLQILNKIITRDDLISLIWKRILKNIGYELNPEPNENCPLSGVIVRSGDVITVDYGAHQHLYPLLWRLGLASSPDWVDDCDCIHVSSGQISGSLTSYLDGGISKKGNVISNEQVMTLVKYKKIYTKLYSGWDKIMETIRLHTNIVENHGGKYNNLMFLKKYYPHIKLPAFSKSSNESFINELLCVRTSPKYSLPGLLHSRFNIKQYKSIQLLTEEMEKEFEEFKNLREDNEFHFFFQEFIFGINGVCNYSRSGFSYAIGNEQGDVVKGKTSGKHLNHEQEQKLKTIAKELFEDLDIDLQLEFVIKEDDVYIVQLRKIENLSEKTAHVPPPNNVLVKGKTFSKGMLHNISANEILIVNEDADSQELIGHKFLIVKSNIEFSHILALSAALKIPSIYNTGEISLPNDCALNVQAYNEDGYIYKS